MLFPLVLIVPVAASAALYVWFRGFAVGKDYWLTAARVAAMLAVVRIGLVGLGVYLLENTYDWRQLPAYWMALCGLPEMYFEPRPTWRTFASMFRLSALIVAGSAAWTFAVAAIAARSSPKPACSA